LRRWSAPLDWVASLTPGDHATLHVAQLHESLALPPAQALASIGVLLSGEACGVPTDLPWGIPLFGATRHPTQLYFALAALLSLGVLRLVAGRRPLRGTLTAAYLGLQGLTLLLVEALRADSLLLPAGVRAGQVFGLALVLLALLWMRWHTRDTPKVDAIPHVTAIDGT